MMKNYFCAILIGICALTSSFTTQLQAQDYPESSYQLSADGKTLITWKGTEQVIDMNQDTKLREVTAIADYAMQPCRTLNKFVTGSKLKSIGIAAFFAVRTLSDLQLSEGLESIDSDAFAGCSNIQKITFPRSLSFMQDNPFGDNHQLKEVAVAEGSKHFVVKEKMLMNKAEKVLRIVPMAGVNTDLKVPDGTEKIDRYAFGGNIHLERVEIPASVDSIAQNAFLYCEKLHTVICHNETPALLQTQCFSGIDNNAMLYVPDDVVSEYEGSAFWDFFENRIRPISLLSTPSVIDSQAQWLSIDAAHAQLNLLGFETIYSRVNLYNAAGILINTYTPDVRTIDLSPLARGLYILTVDGKSYKFRK